MQEELNVTNVVHPLQLVVVAAIVVVVLVEVVVIIEVEVVVVVVDMVVVEVVVMMGVEAVNIMEVEVVLMMVEVEEAIGVVLMEKTKVGMVRLHQQQPNLIMEGLVRVLVLVGIINSLTIHMVEWMRFLHLQPMLVDPHHIPHLMVDPLRVVMVVRVWVM